MVDIDSSRPSISIFGGGNYRSGLVVCSGTISLDEGFLSEIKFDFLECREDALSKIDFLLLFILGGTEFYKDALLWCWTLDPL